MRRAPTCWIASLVLSLTACGGGGASGPAATSGGESGGILPDTTPTPLGATLTFDGRFGIQLAGSEPMTAIVLHRKDGSVIRFVGLYIEPGELWEEPAPARVDPDTYLVRTYGVSGWTYARMFTYIPGLAEAPYISNGNLEIESIDPDFDFTFDFKPSPGGSQEP